MRTINEKHLAISEEFTQKVVKELQKPLDIKAYRAEENSWGEHVEELELKLPGEAKVKVTFVQKVPKP